MADETVAAKSRRSIWRGVVAVGRRIRNTLWGYDFFISYHWASGGTYAVALAQQLRDKHYAVFLDRAEYAHGDDWKKIGAVALQNTQRLVLIATREAVTISEPVAIEVRQFSRRAKHVIPIVFMETSELRRRSTLADLSRESNPVLALISESTLHIDDDLEQLKSHPSKSVVDRLIATQSIVRRRSLRAIVFGTAIACVIAFAAFATLSWGNAILARKAAELARDDAERKRVVASNNLAEAQFALGRIQLEKGDHEAALLWWAKAFSTTVDPKLLASSRSLIGGWVPRERRLIPDWAVLAIAFSSDGRTVLTGSSDYRARRWDAKTGSPRGQPLKHKTPVGAVAFSPDGATVLTGSRDNTARLRGVQTDSLRSKSLKHEGWVRAVAFSPDGSTVLTGSDDDTARMWDARTGAPRGDPLKHQALVRAVAFDSDGATVLTYSDDNTVRLWDAKTGKPFGEPLKHESVGVNAVAFSPDGATILTGSDENTARLWDAKKGAPLGVLLTHEHWVEAVAFSLDGATVLTGSMDNAARLWDVPPPAIDDRKHPDRLRLSVEVRTGKRLDDNGVVQRLSLAEWIARRLELDKIGGPCDAPTWAEYNAWKAKQLRP